MVAHDKEILKQAQEREQKAVDSMRTIVSDIREKLLIEKNKPEKVITKRYETIIYMDVTDSTIVESVTRETSRYRAKRQ